MLGFDVDPAQTARLLADWSECCEAHCDSDEIRQREDEILNIFVDICSLFQHKPRVNDPTIGEAPSDGRPTCSPTCGCSTLAARGYRRISSRRSSARSPTTAFRRSTARPELEESLLWIYKSHQRMEQQVAPIVAVLERRLRARGNAGAARRASRSASCSTG